MLPPNAPLPGFIARAGIAALRAAVIASDCAWVIVPLVTSEASTEVTAASGPSTECPGSACATVTPEIVPSDSAPAIASAAILFFFIFPTFRIGLSLDTAFRCPHI